jgi:pilus assembly protein CpaB
MNRRFIIMLSIALLLALLAAWVAKGLIQGRATPDTMVSVVAAAVEIPFGVKLEESQVKVIAWPVNSAPQGAYSSIEQVVGRITMNKFYPDEIITEKRISEHGNTLSARIAKGSRAMTVRVDDVSGVAGFLSYGSMVDILATKIDQTANQATTRTLLQNIKVLAVDQDVSQEKEKPTVGSAVTLELKPGDAEKIVKALQEGTIQLTLRNPLDDDVADTTDKVVEVQPQPVAITPAKKPVRKIIPW